MKINWGKVTAFIVMIAAFVTAFCMIDLAESGELSEWVAVPVGFLNICIALMAAQLVDE